MIYPVEWKIYIFLALKIAGHYQTRQQINCRENPFKYIISIQCLLFEKKYNTTNTKEEHLR